MKNIQMIKLITSAFIESKSITPLHANTCKDKITSMLELKFFFLQCYTSKIRMDQSNKCKSKRKEQKSTKKKENSYSFN